MPLDQNLAQMEKAQLVRRLPDAELAYLFKHALTQETAYESLLLKTRREIHLRVAHSIEQLYPDQLDEYAALLAHHFEEASEAHKALPYLLRAANWAQRAAAHREVTALLARAIAIAEQRGQRELAAELHALLGKAFTSLTLWASARPELELALAELAPERVELRAEVLAELAIVNHWLLDVPSTRRYGNQALALAEQLDRNDLAAGALSALALADSSDGLLRASRMNYERAFASDVGSRSPAVVAGKEASGVMLYWLGHFEQAIERNREAARLAQELNDSATYMRALGNLGLALMGSGHYAEALRTFGEVKQFGRKQGIETWTARAIAMESGCHLELFDFAGAETLAEEAREMARASNFIGPVVSAEIDLLFNYARRQEPGRVARLVPAVAEQVELGKGAHGWLWGLRFAQARAELALVQENWDEAFAAAEETITRSRASGRVKYLSAGQQARGQALAGMGRKRKGLVDLRAAVKRARRLGDPAAFLRAAAARLSVEADDTLSAEARTVARRVAASLPSHTLRDHFEAFASEHF